MEQIKPQLNQPIQPQPGNTDAILEASLMHRDRTSKETQQLKEAEIMQREKHQQEKVPLLEAQVKLQAKTIQQLEELAKKMDLLNVAIKGLMPKEKKLGAKKGEKGQKLVLTKEMATALKELKTKTNDYKLLLKYISKT